MEKNLVFSANMEMPETNTPPFYLCTALFCVSKPHESFSFPFQLFVLNHLLGKPYTPPELTPAACLTLLFFAPFDFTHAVPFICHIILQTLLLKTLLFFRVQLRFASAMKMP